MNNSRVCECLMYLSGADSTTRESTGNCGTLEFTPPSLLPYLSFQTGSSAAQADLLCPPPLPEVTGACHHTWLSVSL